MQDTTKKSFVLYLDYAEHLDQLTDAECGQLLRAIFAHEDPERPEPTYLRGATAMAYSFIKAQLDRDREEYEKKCEKNRKNGLKGGRPTKPKESQKTERFFEKPKKPDNDNDNDNDINIKENIKEKYGEFKNVSLTKKEYENIKTLFPNDYKERIQRLDDYIQSTGKKYKDFVATLKNWARKDGYKFPEKKKEVDNSIEIDIDKLTEEEYAEIVRGISTYEEIIRKKEVQNE